MPQILEVFTTERRLFAPETLAWTHIVMESTRERLRQRYNFGQINFIPNPDPNAAQVLAVMGEFKTEADSWPILQLLITPNAVEFQLTGSSMHADIFFEDLAKFIGQSTAQSRLLEEKSEYARTYQTIAVAKLNFRADALISASFNEFLTKSVQRRLERPDAQVEIELQHLSWKISYKTEQTSFWLLPRELRIEPRQGSRPEDNLFFTQSPSDFDTHLKILDSLEREFSPQK